MDAGTLTLLRADELAEKPHPMVEPVPSDAALVRGAQAGDHAAFEILVRRHTEKVMRLALGMLGKRDDAEDVTQEVFCRAFAQLRRFRGASRFSTWIYRIAVNLCRDVIRKRKTSEAALGPEPGEPSPLERWDRRGPDDSTMRAEDLKSLARLVEELAPRPRAALLLRVVQGLPHDEIAAILGTTPASSRVYVAEARKSLLTRWSGAQARTRSREEGS